MRRRVQTRDVVVEVEALAENRVSIQGANHPNGEGEEYRAQDERKGLRIDQHFAVNFPEQVIDQRRKLEVEQHQPEVHEERSEVDIEVGEHAEVIREQDDGFD